MEVLVFDIRGPLAHFRRPDTTNTHATYPFIPYTTVRGLAGSIIGLSEFKGTARVGIRLMSPARTSVQQMSMLGKGWLGGGPDFNRPTAIELVINPYYRIYWSGDYYKELKDYIANNHSHCHTYLGSAFALTYPNYVGTYSYSAKDLTEKPFDCLSVIPIDAVGKLIPIPGTQYGRIGGMHCEYHGERRFGTIANVLYEFAGRPIRIIPYSKAETKDYTFIETEQGEIICLW
ncbi:MAG: CRISPR-associated protein Cas5 [bacterium]|jgi:CRISPR-associated protein Cas5h